MAKRPSISFIGTGLMGAPMAQHLIAAGYRTTVWNRSISKTHFLVSAGAILAETPAACVANSDIVFSMLSDGAATNDILQIDGLLPALKPGAIWIDLGSARPDEARSQSALLSNHQTCHLDAPVSGGTKAAHAGTLAIMVGGAPETFQAAEPILRTLGRPTFVGPSGTGQLAKLANQAIVGVTIAAVAEATLLLEQGGADPTKVRTALAGGFADSTILQQHGARMSARDFAPGGPVRLQLKDLRNVLSEAAAQGIDLPATKQAEQRFALLHDTQDGSELDHSALFLELLKRNGLSET